MARTKFVASMLLIASVMVALLPSAGLELCLDEWHAVGGLTHGADDRGADSHRHAHGDDHECTEVGKIALRSLPSDDECNAVLLPPTIGMKSDLRPTRVVEFLPPAIPFFCLFEAEVPASSVDRFHGRYGKSGALLGSPHLPTTKTTVLLT
jgi:hypothetical protein